VAWRVAVEAEADLQIVMAEGIDRFGERQARAYLARVFNMFETLASHPHMAAPHEVDGLQLRLMPFGRHHILYLVDNEDVVILRVLHALQNWPDLI
jgi:toxin ParE1/3/4